MGFFKASLVLGAALSFAAPLAFSEEYAAIAYDEASGRFGYSYGFDSLQVAEQRALAECGRPSCQLVVWVADGCAALARSTTQTNVYGWAWSNGADNTVLQSAQQSALSYCYDSAGYPNCYLLTSTCSFW